MNNKAIKLPQENPSSFSTNLRHLMSRHKLSINQFAQALQIPVMTVRRLLSGETTDPRISTLKLLADYFDVSIDSLFDEGHSGFVNASKKAKPHFVPIIPWEMAEKMNSIQELDLSQHKTWQPFSLPEQNDIGEHAFALESRPSMYPRFPQGTVFVIDPDIQPRDGDVVLIKIKQNHELTLRELIIDPPEWHLQPITSGAGVLHYSEHEHQIVGVNLLTLLLNQRIYG